MAVMPVLSASGWNEECQTILQQYLDLREHIVNSGLLSDIDRAPLLNVSRILVAVLTGRRATNCSICSTSSRPPS